MPLPELEAHRAMLPVLQAEEALQQVAIFQFARLAVDQSDLSARQALLDQWRMIAARFMRGITGKVNEWGVQIVESGAELKAWLASWDIFG
ncbi:MAG: hypothetical protein ACTHMP_10120 [Thermomicrobiales bacterium]